MNNDFEDIQQSRYEINEMVTQLLKQRRLEKGISMGLLSKLAGIDQGHISRIESGVKKHYTFGILAKLFVALDIRFSEIDKLLE